MQQLLIPTPDALPAPGPIWIFKFLNMLGFFLHMVPMNFILGGSIIAVVSLIVAKRTGQEHYNLIAYKLAKIFPFAIAAAVTLGVAPLLFVQVIYGHLFYTSSILIGWFWLAVVPILMIAYYLAYLAAFKWDKLGAKRLLVVCVTSLFFVIIGFIFSNNLTLMISPEKWAEMYFSNPQGLQLNLDEQTLVPRYLHFLTAALALGGLLVAFVGRVTAKKEKEIGNKIFTYAVKWLVGATVIQYFMGLLFLASLPSAFALKFIGDNLLSTSVLFIGIGSSVIAIYLFWNSTKDIEKRGSFYSGLGFLLITLISMVIVRDQLRDYYLEGLFDYKTISTSPQWDLIGIFAVILVAGLGTLAYMLTKFFSTKT